MPNCFNNCCYHNTIGLKISKMVSDNIIIIESYKLTGALKNKNDR